MQFSSQLRAAAGLVVCVIGTGAAVLGQTLPEMARELGGEAVNQIGIDAPVSSIREAVLDSDLVLRGDIVALRTRLNADESTVETEYGIRPTEAFKDRLPRAVQTPRTVSTVVFRRGIGDAEAHWSYRDGCRWFRIGPSNVQGSCSNGDSRRIACGGRPGQSQDCATMAQMAGQLVCSKGPRTGKALPNI